MSENLAGRNLTYGDVEQLFLGLLQRYPESENVIQNHIKFGTIAKLSEFLTTSQEFRDRFNKKYAIDISSQIDRLVDVQLGLWISSHINTKSYENYCIECKSLSNKFVFTCDRSSVVMNGKADNAYLNIDRANHYLELLQDVLRCYPIDGRIELVIDVDDEAHQNEDVPVFSFQKPRGGANILLPDFDMFSHGFLGGALDERNYEDKLSMAIFAGATTGARVIDMNIAQNALTTRLRSAQYFKNEPLVDYRLPKICQCASDEVADYLRHQGHGKDPIGWGQMLQYKFIISVDGNGATCGRVALALRSNSCLVKYHSDNVLYYFDAMIPYLHYIPVSRDEEVIDHVKREIQKPQIYKHIAQHGSHLAVDLLSKDAVYLYTGRLLGRFFHLMRQRGLAYS
ncbi:glycosyl transferase family 90 [Methylorubrum extorquens]|uniref:Lipopolysaccharide-modifying protein n=1 Tax=Methylorubrum extorquens DSM 13060 TaxID=882800 RepID=H1KJL9_METEX|nr:glycosyl transferase family 90 [Methylorubrum extorquens]EHP92264.1 lipopolysaccharide-modifying protein [Methylorubrum extorquens DSM 13060]